MTGAEVLDIARDAILTLVLVASPLMLIGLAVGVAISLIQALTQIQEMTLVFVPKILRDLCRHDGRSAVYGGSAAQPYESDRCPHRRRVADGPSADLTMRIDVSVLPAMAAAFMLVFARIGMMVMLLPGLGELTVPVRIRLTVALILAAVLLPLHRDAYHIDLTSARPRAADAWPGDC